MILLKASEYDIAKLISQISNIRDKFSSNRGQKARVYSCFRVFLYSDFHVLYSSYARK